MAIPFICLRKFMGIFLNVLKIILIVLVSIIALLLLVVLLIVLPFFTYKFNAKKDKEFSAFFSINYPLSIVKAILSYDKEGVFFTLKLFNIKVYRKTIEELIEMFLKDDEEAIENNLEAAGDNREAIKSEEIKPDNTVPDDTVNKDTKASVNQSIENADVIENIEASNVNKQQDLKQSGDDTEASGDNKKKQSLEDKFKHIVSKILEKWYNVKEFFGNLYNNIQKVEKYIKYYIKVINYKSMEPALKVVKKTLISLYKMLFPKKVYGLIEYGNTDPQACAKMYGYYCFIYPKFGKTLEYIPHFDEDMCKLNVTVKGHFQLFGLAIIALRLVLNKDVKTMIRLFKGEGLKRGRE